MASPFPGMDPFLEDPGEWLGIHNRLIGILGELLSRQVLPGFFVASETSVYVLTPDDFGRRLIRPDLFLVEQTTEPANRSAADAITAPLHITPQWPMEVRQVYLEVRDRQHRRVVATIELLSPFNKAPDSTGQIDFRSKRQRIMASQTHWLEIDLLRAGDRPPEVERVGDYYALLKRGDSVDDLEVWPVSLRDRLPVIAVPLLSPLPDAPLDLQVALDILFNRFGYATWLDYNQPPPSPPLNAADARWVEERIRRWRDAG